MREEDIKSFEDAFFDALNLFNNQKWYEAHDAFEEIWNTLDGDERQIIQGILQVSVSQFHLSKGNLNGATILLGEGLGRIKDRINIIETDKITNTNKKIIAKKYLLPKILESVNFKHDDPFVLTEIWDIRGNQRVEFSIPLSEISFH